MTTEVEAGRPGGAWPRIRKGTWPSGVTPNVVDVDAEADGFSWERARDRLDGLPDGRGLNIAHEAFDDRASIQEAMDLDSMDFLDLVTRLHEETGIEVPERDYPLLSTVGGFAAYVEDASERDRSAP